MALRAAHWLAGNVLAQLAFAITISVLSSTTLIGATDGCYLDLSGGTCEFLAITGYFSLAFGVVTALAVAATLRTGPTAYLPTAVGSLQAFGSLWWLAAAATATTRGQQAAGEPEGSARDAVIGLSWVELALYLSGTAAVIYDRINLKLSSGVLDGSRPMLDVESQSSSLSERHEFKKAAVDDPGTPR